MFRALFVVFIGVRFSLLFFQNFLTILSEISFKPSSSLASFMENLTILDLYTGLRLNMGQPCGLNFHPVLIYINI